MEGWLCQEKSREEKGWRVKEKEGKWCWKVDYIVTM